MIATGIVMKTSDDQAFIKIARNTACESCGACHCDEKVLNLEVTAINNVGAKEGDQVELSMENVNFFRASFFLYGIPLITLLVGIFAGLAIFENIGLAFADLWSIGLGIMFMGITYMILRHNKERFAENKRYMSVITKVLHHGEFPVI